MSLFIVVGGGATDYERQLEAKRNVLRRALKREYIKQRFDPKSYAGDTGPAVFDAAFYRWQATHNSTDYLMRNNFRAKALFVGIILAPTLLLTNYGVHRKVSIIYNMVCHV